MIIEMKKKEVMKSEIGLVANQGDFTHVFISD